ncbi:MAG: heparinase II/III domain-containing protein [Planctomycetota bacterium]|jgi:hypothetical protein
MTAPNATRLAALLGAMVIAACEVVGGAEPCPKLLLVQPGRLAPVTLEDGAPRFHIPSDCPLARNEHPRLLLTGEDLDTFRRRAADPRMARLVEIIAQRSFGKYASNLERAVVYRLTGEERYLKAILDSPELTRPSFGFTWAGTIDLIWDDLTPERRRELSDTVAKSIARDGELYWRPTLPLASVFYEGGKGPNDEALLARMKHDFDRALVHWTDKLNHWAAGRGGSDMSHGYNGEHAYWEPFSAAVCWANSIGEDYVGRAAFAKYQSPFYWYHFVPRRDGLVVEKIGVTRSAHDLGSIAPRHSGAHNLLYLTFTRENDGLGLAWMDRVHSQEPHWSRDRDAVGRLLWWDPEQEPLDPSTLPTTRLFPTSGHVVMRSDWTPEATFATFRCGRFGEIDGYWGRNNADNLSFTIRKLGPLAIDSGPVHEQNVSVLHFHSSAARTEYGRQTIAHNSITVGRGEYVHHDWRKQPTSDVTRRGGQSVRQADDWWEKWGFDGPQKAFMEGRITTYRTHPWYDYMLGDARFSYNPDDVEEITRQFVYLKPDVFVVYDRIVPADPAKQPCWMLHSLREPKATGQEKPLGPDEIGPQLLQTDEGKIPHPRPGGHFAMSGDGFHVESGSPGERGGGRLTVRTLFPPEDAARRKKIGGRGHDFEVAGIQYGLAEDGYKMADDPYAVLSTIGVLGWRVELRHEKPSKTVEFLHVMQTGTAPPADVDDALVESTADVHTVKLQHDEKSIELRLRRTGKRGGSIRVKPANEAAPLHEAALPDTVEDHWRQYKDRRHFSAWVADPRYRVVIEPTEEDKQ